MRAVAECRGTVPVPLPVSEAFRLFTPEGERRWVPEWDPSYPAGPAAPAAGLAFVTGEGREARTWVVTRFEPDAGLASYAYVLPGRRTAVIDVVVEPGPDGGSRARVAYGMTSLSPDEDGVVEEFAAGFEAMMVEWAELIAALPEVEPGSSAARDEGPLRDR
ncbi:MAG: hypothetical protein GWM90_18165 [Gemmatimonadetes bacterium]|nr:hypothetical protein [Gemmatimonadota bacterium]NIQ56274.1 hypothetical protein [Gemmatimonadota bacterium]NIU76462.1 hypothetical protein [Gammaproteobacteria bacterium]NIX45946.1 hypothetical protein [Gemmatimonadota bacterium]NIY10267.1 hypothetical protein [Gemmatimonadota bacterium]